MFSVTIQIKRKKGTLVEIKADIDMYEGILDVSNFPTWHNLLQLLGLLGGLEHIIIQLTHKTVSFTRYRAPTNLQVSFE